MRPRVLAILGYHKFGAPRSGWRTWFYVPEVSFSLQLQWLLENGWSVIDLEAFIQMLEGRGDFPERAALITIDDGCRSVLDVGLPCLRRFGFPAVMFVPTDFVGRTNEFDCGIEPVESICDWNELRGLEQAGVAIQAHGASHRRFSGLDPGQQEEELRRSKGAIEDRLGRAVAAMAFPFGDNGSHPEVTRRLLVRTGYRAALLYGGGPTTIPASEPYALDRIAVGPDTDLERELGDQGRFS